MLSEKMCMSVRESQCYSFRLAVCHAACHCDKDVCILSCQDRHFVLFVSLSVVSECVCVLLENTVSVCVSAMVHCDHEPPGYVAH